MPTTLPHAVRGIRIRFEHGADVPRAPDGAPYRFGYRYALTQRTDTYADWERGRTLASFEWTDLGAFTEENRLAKVWLALSREGVAVFPPTSGQSTFAVNLKIRPPIGRTAGIGAELIKAVFDGVISAFQAHTDTADLTEIVARLARYLPADAAEIESLLLDRCVAVLGCVPRLVYLRDAGVQWNPADDRCVAGELLAVEPVDQSWAISGELVEAVRVSAR